MEADTSINVFFEQDGVACIYINPSLYNALFGFNDHTSTILDILSRSKHDFDRFRDVFVYGGLIHILARNGTSQHNYDDGPPSEDCNCVECMTNFRISKYPYYYSTASADKIDSSYVIYSFSYPPEHADWLKSIEHDVDLPDMWKKMETAMNASGADLAKTPGLPPKTVKAFDFMTNAVGILVNGIFNGYDQLNIGVFDEDINM